MITFNNTQPPQQPSGLDENPKLVQTDTSAIDGSVSRMQMPIKKRAVLTYSMATQATVAYYNALYSSVSPVAYQNTRSNQGSPHVINNGVITVSQSEYVRGGSLLTELTVIVEEGVVNA